MIQRQSLRIRLASDVFEKPESSPEVLLEFLREFWKSLEVLAGFECGGREHVFLEALAVLAPLSSIVISSARHALPATWTSLRSLCTLASFPAESNSSRRTM